MRGIALDIETSGHNIHKHNVLEIGLVYFNLEDCGDDDWLDAKLKTKCFREELHLWPQIYDGIFWDMDTLKFHGPTKVDYFMEERIRMSGNVIALEIQKFIEKNYDLSETPVLLGKNVGKFDWPFLMRITNGQVNNMFYHGFLDIGSLAFNPGKDKKIPSLESLCARYDVKLPSHKALDDCHTTIDILHKIYIEELSE